MAIPEEADVLNKPGQVHVADSVRHSSPEELYIVFQLELQPVALDQLHKGDESEVPFKHGNG